MSIGRLSKHWRETHNYWQYNGDGRFSHERIKGFDKHWLKRRRRRYEQRMALTEVENP